MSSTLRRHGPYTTILLLILFFIITYFFVMPPQVGVVNKTLLNWGSLAAAFAVLVGTIDISRMHVEYIRKMTKGQWPFSVVLLAILVITFVAGSYSVLAGFGTVWVWFAWIYNAIYIPSNATIYAILVFYLASASFRAFRVRNLQAFLLVLVGFIVMFANITIGYVIWPGFTPLSDWINRYLVAAAYRPIIIGAGLGVIITGLRALLGREIYRR
jgi:hypothetical protein